MMKLNNGTKCSTNIFSALKQIYSTDEKQWKTQPDTIPIKTLVTPVTFSSSHYLIQHMRHICSTSSPEDCEQLHIIQWNKVQGTPCASHPSCFRYSVCLKNRLLLVRLKQKEKEKVNNRYI